MRKSNYYQRSNVPYRQDIQAFTLLVVQFICSFPNLIKYGMQFFPSLLFLTIIGWREIFSFVSFMYQNLHVIHFFMFDPKERYNILEQHILTGRFITTNNLLCFLTHDLKNQRVVSEILWDLIFARVDIARVNEYEY